MPSSFLLEILTEDLPARVVVPTSKQLREKTEAALREARLPFQTISAFGTNRRWGVFVSGLAERQESFEEEITGPPAKAAFAPDGKPTPVGIKFAEGKGGRAEDLKKVSTPKGEYAAVRVKRGGKSASDILAEACPKMLASLDFPITMRWGAGEYEFIRPILSVTALFGQDIVPFSFCGVASGRATRGHRSLDGDERVEITSADEYFAVMRKVHVEPDIAKRRADIKARLLTEGADDMDDAMDVMGRGNRELLDTITASFEWPRVFMGAFEEKYLSLPREVLISSMREHQKYFAVERNGQLLPRFLTVMEVEETAAEGVLAYHQKTLRSRLDDAAFFYEQDRKEPLESRLEKLKGMVFHEQLGTYYDKALRLEKLAPRLAELAGYGHLAEDLRRAARLCKCDLATAMVYEFPSLQGVMGGIYIREKEYGTEREADSAVWRAVYHHYEESFTGAAEAILALADRMDTLAGFFLVGQIPSGSKDPYALRQKAYAVVRMLMLDGDYLKNIALIPLIDSAFETYPNGVSAPEAKLKLEHFLLERFAHERVSVEIVRAVLGAAWDGKDGRKNVNFRAAEKRAAALHELRDSADMKALAIAFKRVKNILKQAEEKDIPVGSVNAALLKERSEDALHKIIVKMRGHIADDVKKGDYETAFKRLASMRVSVDQFFTDVMVLCDDEALKKNRIALMKELHDLFMSLADISALAVSTKEGA